MNISTFLAGAFLANLQLALEQPAIPGKLIFAALLVLSVAVWVLICTKFLFLRKHRRADAAFDLHLDRSRYLMEAYQEEQQDESLQPSLHREIYLHGAEEAVTQLNSAETASAARSRGDDESTAPVFSDRQLAALRESLRQGKSAAEERLATGLFSLQAIAVVAPLIGAAGMFWTLQRGFASAGAFAEVIPAVSASLLYVVLALAVAAPASVFRLLFLHLNARRSKELDEFRLKLGYVFEEDFTDRQAFRPKGNEARDEDSPPPLPDEEEEDRGIDALGTNGEPEEPRFEENLLFPDPVANRWEAESSGAPGSPGEDDYAEVPLPQRSSLSQEFSPEVLEAQLENTENPGTDERATAVFHAENEVEVKYKKPEEPKKQFHSIRSPEPEEAGNRWNQSANPVAEQATRQVSELESH